MIKIWLTGKNGKGFFALIDNKDVKRVTEYPWSLHKHGYAVASISGKQMPLHRFIMRDVPMIDGDYIDHKNMNRLDNRLQNLRICSFSQNLSNSKSRFGRKYKGVYEEKHKKFRRFHAQAMVNGKRHSFGRYLTAEEAAYAYDREIVKLRGEFARLNFPGKSLT